MKNLFGLVFCLYGAAIFVFACHAQDSPNAADTLKQYVADLQKSPDDRDLREKIIHLATTMNPKPEIPEAARGHFIKAATLLKAVSQPSDYRLAENEFLQARDLAPWWPDVYYNLAITREAEGPHPTHNFGEPENVTRDGLYEAAIKDLKLYLASNPDDARKAQDKIYQIQAEKDLAAQHASDEQAKAQEEASKKEAYNSKLGFLEGRWQWTRRAHASGMWANVANSINNSDQGNHEATIQIKDNTVTIFDVKAGSIDYERPILTGRIVGDGYSTIAWHQSGVDSHGRAVPDQPVRLNVLNNNHLRFTKGALREDLGHFIDDDSMGALFDYDFIK